MSAHVPPWKWAAKVGDVERAQMNAHAEGCRRCGRGRDQVTDAIDSFKTIANKPAPELSWDSVRARVHWSVSTAKHEALRSPRRRWLPYAIGVAAIAGAATAYVTTRSSTPEAAPVAAAPALAPPAPIASERTPASSAAEGQRGRINGLVSRTAGDVRIDGATPTDLFASVLAAGSTLATGDGRVDVQFGEGSAFALGPKSSLELRHFDKQLIELAIDGTVDVEVSSRAAGQRFLVHAGDTVVEVRGTQFRVEHDARGTTVACRHGLVAVSDRTGLVEVGAQKRVAITRQVRGEVAAVMTKEESDKLITPLALPLWSDALAQTSAPLALATAGHREVRVDGVELGVAPMRVRVMLGRHTVEAADASGRFRRAGWVDVAANHAALLELPSANPTGGIAERKHQLQVGLDRVALARCTRAIAKQGLENTFVEVELKIDATGAVSYLNVIDTDLPTATASCVRDVLAGVRFGAGPEAAWRQKLEM